MLCVLIASSSLIFQQSAFQICSLQYLSKASIRMVYRRHKNFWAFTRARIIFGLILLIWNMIIHRSFTGPTHLLLGNVWGPVSFAVCGFTSVIWTWISKRFRFLGIFSCDQAALQMVFSVRLSHLFDYVPIIVSSWNFQELLPMTKVRSMQKVKVRGQRSRSQRSQPNVAVSGLSLQFEFTYDDEMMHIAWCCLEEVPYCFSRSSVKFQGHKALKLVEFDPNWAFPDCNSSLKSPMAMKWCTKLEVA